jgi:hypothetical protein
VSLLGTLDAPQTITVAAAGYYHNFLHRLFCRVHGKAQGKGRGREDGCRDSAPHTQQKEKQQIVGKTYENKNKNKNKKRAATYIRAIIQRKRNEEKKSGGRQR